MKSDAISTNECFCSWIIQLSISQLLSFTKHLNDIQLCDSYIQIIFGLICFYLIHTTLHAQH